MQDFRNTKLKVLSEEHSAAFQEAVFEAGGSWKFPSRTSPDYLDKLFLFVDSNLFLTHTDDIDWFEDMEYEEIFFPEPNKGHIHAELMAQYAEDARTTDRPWELWEGKNLFNKWVPLPFTPVWETNREYRRKPKTKLIHGVEIPDISFTPAKCEMYYYPYTRSPELFGEFLCCEVDIDAHLQRQDMCYPYTDEGKEAAILHAKAMLGIA